MNLEPLLSTTLAYNVVTLTQTIKSNDYSYNNGTATLNLQEEQSINIANKKTDKISKGDTEVLNLDDNEEVADASRDCFLNSSN